ncbi:MAG: phosphoribosylformylglycinamidine synthase [Clostridia bacterium]|nr:phosphoribosylformylglycinamidine synthase [Clostridia bacterium]
MVNRIYVEKLKQFDSATGKIRNDIKHLLGIECDYLRRILRYDVEGIDECTLASARVSIFSEPTVDITYDNLKEFENKQILVVEYLDGQYDQRADSAAQCVQLLTAGIRPLVRCATVFIFENLSDEQFAQIKKYLINPVDSKEGTILLPGTLKRDETILQKMRIDMDGFIDMDKAKLKDFYSGFGFAMNFEDISFVQDYFTSQKRNPTLTELKVIDTYWSDHCRHTTFLTEIKSVKVESDNPHIEKSLELYREKFGELYSNRPEKYPCLMDIATLAVKQLRKEGYLRNLDESEEINACSVVVAVDNGGENEDWLIMFKNETHNHPTEIEPFGGAATCLGGAIRDPLSGRSYVYQAMRITGAGNPLESHKSTLSGKLPQRVLTKTALAGFSSYGNQIGLATGIVHELYNDRFKAKRLETGYVIGGAPKANVVRERPQASDIILLVGGDTGRDGCGGATGSSKAHTIDSVDLCGAEVQKGNAPEERKLQRLFRNREVAQMIIRCNDFGAGGVSVAIGELSDSLDIHLECISKKYDGLTATELAISESQERMAVVIKKENVERFLEFAKIENLKATQVAEVTDNGRLRMFYAEETIVDLERKFLDTNGVKQIQDVIIEEKFDNFFDTLHGDTTKLLNEGKFEDALCVELSRLTNCSQKGAGEVFDSTIGAASVLMPFGGKTQLTPATVMVSKPPVSKFTHTVTCSSYGAYPDLMVKSPYIGSIYSIVSAVSKLVASGVEYNTIYLTLQEFFKRLNRDEIRWGEPLSALLGAFDAQINMKIGAIGGKDSMSGTFENIDVPPTLIAFGMGIAKDNNIIHNAFGSSGFIYRFKIAKDYFGKPKYNELLMMYAEIEKLIKNGKVKNSAVEENGFLVTLAKSCIGNQVGAHLNLVDKGMYKYSIGDIILITNEKIVSENAEFMGELNSSGKITAQELSFSIEKLSSAFTGTLESVFSTTAPNGGEAKNISYSTKKIFKGKSIVKPRVFIPVFPGTNCELDTARAFEIAGATADVFVIKNQNAKDIECSIAEMKKLIDKAQIIAFPGGFSGGDEPDGSGKFIATAFRNPILKECVENLLYMRDGLALGICNGFQALIKLGLLPFGKIEPQNSNSATLTFNNIARHVSTMTNIRIASNNSAWLNSFTVGDVFSVPVSHGEGKFICNQETLATLIENGQVSTQYADSFNNATMQAPYNPNGSICAIEGIVSPDGRVLGKMGHSERWQKGLYQNLNGNFDMNIFKNGVEYFK